MLGMTLRGHHESNDLGGEEEGGMEKRYKGGSHDLGEAGSAGEKAGRDE